MRPKNVFGRAAEDVALHDIWVVTEVLDPGDGFEEAVGEAAVAATVAVAVGRIVPFHLARGEVGDGDDAAVGLELAVRAVEVRVSVTDFLRVRDHVEGCLLSASSDRDGAVDWL